MTLSKTQRDVSGRKTRLVTDIRTCVDDFKYVYVFGYRNIRGQLLKDLRQLVKDDSRIIFGRLKVMQVALGREEEDAYADGLPQVSSRLHGSVALLFSAVSLKKMQSRLKEFSGTSYANEGHIPTESITIPKGPLPVESFSHAIEPHLRTLGLNTELVNGVIHLLEPAVPCTEGKSLTTNQARLLKLWHRPIANVECRILCQWSKGKYTEVEADSNEWDAIPAGGRLEEEEMDQDDE